MALDGEPAVGPQRRGGPVRLGRHEPGGRFLHRRSTVAGDLARRTCALTSPPSTYGRRPMESARVASAIRRARHAGRSPPITLAHSRGSRCRSSTALTQERPTGVGGQPHRGRELRDAELRHQRRPLPSDGQLRLRRNRWSLRHRRSSSRESTECIAAPRHRRLQDLSFGAIRRRPPGARAKSRTSAAVSSIAARCRVTWVPLKPAGTDTQTPRTRLLHDRRGHGRITKTHRSKRRPPGSTPTTPPAAHGRCVATATTDAGDHVTRKSRPQPGTHP